MRVVIHGDLHLRHPYIDQMLAWEEPYDRLICLHDTFDFGEHDTAQEAADAAIWLKAKLADPRHTFVESNHGWSYRWPANGWAFCPGFTEAKAHAINAVLTEEDWAKVLPYHAIHEWDLLFTHAGVDRHLFTMLASMGRETPRGDLTLRAVTEWLDAIWPQVLVRYQAGSFHPVMECGRSRGGFQTIGGITWHDLNEHTPLPGLIQVVGHTQRDIPLFRFHQGKGSKAPMWRRADKGPIKTHWLASGATLGLDTANHHYAVLDTLTGILTIRQVIWRRNWDANTGMDEPGFNVAQGRILAHIQLPRPAPVQPPSDQA